MVIAYVAESRPVLPAVVGQGRADVLAAGSGRRGGADTTHDTAGRTGLDPDEAMGALVTATAMWLAAGNGHRGGADTTRDTDAGRCHCDPCRRLLRALERQARADRVAAGNRRPGRGAAGRQCRVDLATHAAMGAVASATAVGLAGTRWRAEQCASSDVATHEAMGSMAAPSLAGVATRRGSQPIDQRPGCGLGFHTPMGTLEAAAASRMAAGDRFSGCGAASGVWRVDVATDSAMGALASAAATGLAGGDGYAGHRPAGRQWRADLATDAAMGAVESATEPWMARRDRYRPPRATRARRTILATTTLSLQSLHTATVAWVAERRRAQSVSRRAARRLGLGASMATLEAATATWLVSPSRWDHPASTDAPQWGGSALPLRRLSPAALARMERYGRSSGADCPRSSPIPLAWVSPATLAGLGFTWNRDGARGAAGAAGWSWIKNPDARAAHAARPAASSRRLSPGVRCARPGACHGRAGHPAVLPAPAHAVCDAGHPIEDSTSGAPAPMAHPGATLPRHHDDARHDEHATRLVGRVSASRRG